MAEQPRALISRSLSMNCMREAGRKNENGDFLTYRELAADLIPYVKDMGFTHIETDACGRASPTTLPGVIR